MEVYLLTANDSLVAKRSSPGLHFVMLEGGAGCGKLSMLQRLSNLGYQSA
jgi:hypothetical protein